MAADRLTPTSATPGTVTGDSYMDAVQEELTALFNSTPFPLSNIAGTANAITADVTPDLTAGLVHGMQFILDAASDITGACTISISGETPVDMVDHAGVALRKGQILAAGRYLLEYDGTTGDIYVLNANTSIGKQSRYIRADQMVSRTTAGPSDGTVELTTNKLMLKTKDFDQTTEEYVQFHFTAEEKWDLSTMTARFIWGHTTGGATFNVVWGIQGLSLSDDDAMDTAFGTGITVTDSGGTGNDIYRSAETSAFTLSNTPAKGDELYFQVYRKAADAADTLNLDARLIGVQLFWNSIAPNEA